MSLKDRIRFSVAGMHPLLSFVRDSFIKKGLALVAWGDETDFCLIGAEIEDTTHPPLAQLELQKMQIGETPVLLLSSPKATIDLRKYNSSPEDRAAALYALSAEHIFQADNCVVIRPYNVFGPDINTGMVYDILEQCKKRKSYVVIPGNRYIPTSFLYQDDFIITILDLLKVNAKGIIELGSPSRITLGQTVTTIWDFIHNSSGAEVGITPNNKYYSPLPNLRRLESYLNRLPKTTLRSGLLKML